MTTSTLSTDLATSIVAELGGSSPTNVEMMIGVGLVKDSAMLCSSSTWEKSRPLLHWLCLLVSLAPVWLTSALLV